MYNQIHKEVDNVRKEQAKAMELIQKTIKERKLYNRQM